MTPTRSASEGVPILAARFLERALLFTIAAHLIAMATMALILLPGVPGGTTNGIAQRAEYVANNPWLWRIGWFPWQVTALSDLLIAVALLRTKWIPRLPAIASAMASLLAVLIEQPSEFRWITRGVDLARDAVRTGEYGQYLQFETATYRLVSLWAALCYTLAAIGWSWSFAAAGVWNRWLTWLSVLAWGILLLVSAGPLALGGNIVSTQIIAAGNAIGFVLMMTWFALVTEQVLRRSRPDDVHGRYAGWRHFRSGPLSSVINLSANSRLLRAMGELLPSPSFVSDITNVIYINYLVEAERLKGFVPAGLELQRLGPDGRYGLFTFLTYRHGHFGPRFFGPLRQLLPSPIQSNWRIHVRDPRTGSQGIFFISTAITALPNALAARHLSEGVSMHVPRAAELTVGPDGSIRLRIEPGNGSSPDVDAVLHPSEMPGLTGPWKECFTDFREFLAYCVPQDRALSSQPWYGRITRQEIQLGIPLEACEPLIGEVHSRAAHVIAGDAAPICFRVPQVAFRYDGEEYDYNAYVASNCSYPDRGYAAQPSGCPRRADYPG